MEGIVTQQLRNIKLTKEVIFVDTVKTYLQGYMLAVYPMLYRTFDSTCCSAFSQNIFLQFFTIQSITDIVKHVKVIGQLFIDNSTSNLLNFFLTSSGISGNGKSLIMQYV